MSEILLTSHLHFLLALLCFVSPFVVRFGGPPISLIEPEDSGEVAGDQIPESELLTFTFQQLLAPDFVLKQVKQTSDTNKTRTENRNECEHVLTL